MSAPAEFHRPVTKFPEPLPKIIWHAIYHTRLSTTLVLLALSLALYGDAVQVSQPVTLSLFGIVWAATFIALIGCGSRMVHNSWVRHHPAR